MSDAQREADELTAWCALESVLDPELRLDVVSLGLVYDVQVSEDAVVVEMTLTTPGCPASETIPAMASEAVRSALGDERAVDVRLVWDPPWDPTMMDASAMARLGFRLRD